jgi:hypothetical protein
MIVAGLIEKKPFVGLAAGTVFGFLGMLLTSLDSAPGADPKRFVVWLFRIVGYFLLFVALGSILTAVYTLWRNRSGR